jgi:hypothetical protein
MKLANSPWKPGEVMQKMKQLQVATLKVSSFDYMCSPINIMERHWSVTLTMVVHSLLLNIDVFFCRAALAAAWCLHRGCKSTQLQMGCLWVTQDLLVMSHLHCVYITGVIWIISAARNPRTDEFVFLKVQHITSKQAPSSELTNVFGLDVCWQTTSSSSSPRPKRGY